MTHERTTFGFSGDRTSANLVADIFREQNRLNRWQAGWRKWGEMGESISLAGIVTGIIFADRKLRMVSAGVLASCLAVGIFAPGFIKQFADSRITNAREALSFRRYIS